MRGKRPPSAELLEREGKALELRRAGFTYDVIADRLAYNDRSAARKAVERAIGRTHQDAADDLRALEADRLDRLQSSRWSKAIKGDDKAFDRVLRVMERRSKLLGLDTPVQHELTGPGGNPLIVEILPTLIPTMTDPDDDPPPSTS